jgi:hypothetical protein
VSSGIGRVALQYVSYEDGYVSRGRMISRKVCLPNVPGQVLTASEVQSAGRVVGALEALRHLLLRGLVVVDAALRLVPTLGGRLHIDVPAIASPWRGRRRKWKRWTLSARKWWGSRWHPIPD